MKNLLKLFLASVMLCMYTMLPAQAKIDSLAESLGDLEPPRSLGDTVLNRSEFETGDSMQEYKTDRDFAYMKYLDSLLRTRKDLTVDTFSIYNATSSRGQKGKARSSREVSVRQPVHIFSLPAVKIILWILAALLIGFIIWKLFLGENFFRRNRTYKLPGSEKEEEDLDDPSAYDAMIAQAALNKDFRLAIRYSYLQSLKKLSATGVVQYAADKTNYQYVNELRGKAYQEDFAAITLNYEYVWYGKFDIKEDVYQRLATDYKNFNRKI
jgi:hypothetical protein